MQIRSRRYDVWFICNVGLWVVRYISDFRAPNLRRRKPAGRTGDIGNNLKRCTTDQENNNAYKIAQIPSTFIWSRERKNRFPAKMNPCEMRRPLAIQKKCTKMHVKYENSPYRPHIRNISLLYPPDQPLLELDRILERWSGRRERITRIKSN